jgi:hypothetical protein
MLEYRFYAVTRDNHINGAPAILTCESDEEAIRQVEQNGEWLRHRAVVTESARRPG